MFKHVFAGHRFDEETPIAEIVRGPTYELDFVIDWHVYISDVSSS